MMVGNANETNHVRVFYLTQLGLPFSHNLEFICLGKKYFENPLLAQVMQKRSLALQ